MVSPTAILEIWTSTFDRQPGDVENSAHLISGEKPAHLTTFCACIEIQEIPLKIKNKLLYCSSDQAPAQVAQRGYGVSILGDTQCPTAHGPRQPAPAGCFTSWSPEVPSHLSYPVIQWPRYQALHVGHCLVLRSDSQRKCLEILYRIPSGEVRQAKPSRSSKLNANEYE